MKILNWLQVNHDKVLAPEKWAELLEIRIIDPDGWRGQAGPTRKYWFKRDFKAHIPLEEFLIRVSNSTIAPTHDGAPTAWLKHDNIARLQDAEGAAGAY